MTAGKDTRVAYLWEDDGFNSPPTDTTYKPFGANTTITTAQGANNAARVLQPGSDMPVDTIERAFSGTWSATFSLTNPWWLRGVMETPDTSGAGPYTHTYDAVEPSTLEIHIGYEESDRERVLKGCVVSNATLDVTVNSEVRVTLNGAYADEEDVDMSGTAIFTQPTLDERPLAFQHGEVTVGGDIESIVQSAQLTLNTNTDTLLGLGTRFAQGYSPKVMTPDLNLQEVMVGGGGGTDSPLQDMYGGNTAPQETVENKAAATLSIDNGKTGTDENSLTFNLSGTFPENYAESNLGDPTQDIQQTLTRYVETLTADAVNNTTTAP